MVTLVTLSVAVDRGENATETNAYAGQCTHVPKSRRGANKREVMGISMVSIRYLSAEVDLVKSKR